MIGFGVGKMRKTGGGVLGPLVSRGGSRATRARGPRTVGGGSETRVYIQRYRPRPVRARGQLSEDLLLVYRSWQGVSGFGSTSRAQRGDLCDRVLIVRTPCAHIRAERRNLDVTIADLHCHWGLGTGGHRQSIHETILASVSCTTATSKMHHASYKYGLRAARP
jgi:hypothetical protein